MWYSAIFMCLTLAAGEQEKSRPHVQMRETCLPQRQGPALACSSPVQGRVFRAGAREGQGSCFVVLKNCSVPLGVEMSMPSFWRMHTMNSTKYRAPWLWGVAMQYFHIQWFFNFPAQPKAEGVPGGPQGWEDGYHLCSAMCSLRRSADCFILASLDCRARPC